MTLIFSHADLLCCTFAVHTGPSHESYGYIGIYFYEIFFCKQIIILYLGTNGTSLPITCITCKDAEQLKYKISTQS